MGRPGVAGKKRTRRGGRDPGDPPLSRLRCLCPWSKQRGNPPFSSARRAHSYSNHSAAGPRAATFPGRREPPHPNLRSASPGPLLLHFHLHRGGVPGKAASPTRTPGASHQLRCGLWGTKRVAKGGARGHGKREGPGRRQTDIQGYGKRQGGRVGVGVPETQGNVVLGRDKETGSHRRSGDRDSKDGDQERQGVQKLWRRRASPSPLPAKRPSCLSDWRWEPKASVSPSRPSTPTHVRGSAWKKLKTHSVCIAPGPLLKI